jgi:hypothetical protein
MMQSDSELSLFFPLPSPPRKPRQAEKPTLRYRRHASVNIRPQFRPLSNYYQHPRKQSVTTVLVVARSEETRKAVVVALKSRGVDALLLESLAELPHALLQTPVCGILLDLPTLVLASHHEKQSAAEPCEFYPFAKFKLVDGEVRVLSRTIDDFLSECLQFKPRTIREFDRKDMVLAVLLSADGNFETAEKTVTLSASSCGCFIFSVREWNLSDQVWLKFPGNSVVRRGVVCTWHPWGNNRVMPGIGIKLDELWDVASLDLSSDNL